MSLVTVQVVADSGDQIVPSLRLVDVTKNDGKSFRALRPNVRLLVCSKGKHGFSYAVYIPGVPREAGFVETKGRHNPADVGWVLDLVGVRGDLPYNLRWLNKFIDGAVGRHINELNSQQAPEIKIDDLGDIDPTIYYMAKITFADGRIAMPRLDERKIIETVNDRQRAALVHEVVPISCVKAGQVFPAGICLTADQVEGLMTPRLVSSDTVEKVFGVKLAKAEPVTQLDRVMKALGQRDTVREKTALRDEIKDAALTVKIKSDVIDTLNKLSPESVVLGLLGDKDNLSYVSNVKGLGPKTVAKLQTEMMKRKDEVFKQHPLLRTSLGRRAERAFKNWLKEGNTEDSLLEDEGSQSLAVFLLEHFGEHLADDVQEVISSYIIKQSSEA